MSKLGIICSYSYKILTYAGRHNSADAALLNDATQAAPGTMELIILILYSLTRSSHASIDNKKNALNINNISILKKPNPPQEGGGKLRVFRSKMAELPWIVQWQLALFRFIRGGA